MDSKAGPEAGVETVGVQFLGAEQEVWGLWAEATRPFAAAVVAHGAGAGMTHPFMAGVAAGLVEHGVSVLRFDFPYMREGRRSPDRPAVLMEVWRGALREGGRRAGSLPVVAGGKSLGGRMTSMVAAEDGERFPAGALILFGYPLHAPGRTDRLRDDHLLRVTVPMLFLQGTRDALARFDLLRDVVARLGPRARLHPVEGGDHSFRVRGARRPDEAIGRDLGAVAALFTRDVVA
jgi:predicted alpha/beta-hydrolase family hydrolase